MPRQDQHIDISDQAGQLHHYVAYPLPAIKGMAMALEIAAVVGDTLGQLFRGIGGQPVDGASVLDQELGPELAKIPERLISRGGPNLILQLLDGVKRRSSQNGKEVFELVSTPGVFDEIYAANYQELIQAVWWVIRLNYLPFLLGNSTDTTGPLNRPPG
jgi:hypothetical protein